MGPPSANVTRMQFPKKLYAHRIIAAKAHRHAQPAQEAPRGLELRHLHLIRCRSLRLAACRFEHWGAQKGRRHATNPRRDAATATRCGGVDGGKRQRSSVQTVEEGEWVGPPWLCLEDVCEELDESTRKPDCAQRKKYGRRRRRAAARALRAAGSDAARSVSKRERKRA